MCIFESASNLKIDDYNKYFLEETTNDYIKYIKEIEKFEEKLLKHYLAVLKQKELINNHETEDENSFLISLYNNMHKQNSIDSIIEKMEGNRELTINELKQLHKILMRGTESEKDADQFRCDDNRFVGAINPDGTKRIDYIPISYTKIEENMDKVLELYNSKEIDNPFLNPFIVHGLIAVLQPFNDGNTRLSRLIQHAKIWKNTNELYSTNFPKPLLYLSRNYLISRGAYRRNIAELAQNPTDEAWNIWLKYNLNMVKEQLFYLNNNIKKLAR